MQHIDGHIRVINMISYNRGTIKDNIDYTTQYTQMLSIYKHTQSGHLLL